MEEELRSPCYDEVAVFQAFAKIVTSGRKEFVIIDTAPTGHTLLLLDMTGAYHRQMERTFAGRTGIRLTTPLMMLQDPNYTKVLIVTLPETTPVQEAQALQDDLRRAGIEPYAWIVNASLAAARPRDRVLAQRAGSEYEHLRRVWNELAHRIALVPFQAEEPVGAAALLRLATTTRASPSDKTDGQTASMPETT